MISLGAPFAHGAPEGLLRPSAPAPSWSPAALTRGRGAARVPGQGPHDAGVARAAAEVAGESLADARGRGALAERRRGHDDARRADAALRSALADERHGQPAAQALDRRHLPAARVGEGHQAGVDGGAVEEHGARPALALAAPLLRARERAVLPQDVEEPLQRRGLDVRSLAVEDEAHSRTFSGVIGSERMSRPR